MNVAPVPRWVRRHATMLQGPVSQTPEAAVPIHRDNPAPLPRYQNNPARRKQPAPRRGRRTAR
ncbi:hypothetical protein GCM10010299_43750 [Streptomyces tanashiensis]|nr:hypothetical protein GCM10010299_43750 [Streptomyces tanashiensis]